MMKVLVVMVAAAVVAEGVTVLGINEIKQNKWAHCRCRHRATATGWVAVVSVLSRALQLSRNLFVFY